MGYLNSPWLTLLVVWAFAAFGYYSYQLEHRDFVMERLSQYDGKNDGPYAKTGNVIDNPGLVYQADLGALYDTKPVALIGANER